MSRDQCFAMRKGVADAHGVVGHSERETGFPVAQPDPKERLRAISFVMAAEPVADETGLLDRRNYAGHTLDCLDDAVEAG